jgi:hypothetical protein
MLTSSPPVDFGYILGRDPKPYPPPVKVCKEMVDAMGGPSSTHYHRFQSLAYTAFIGLRKNANLILNLVALMVDAGIQDIQLEPDKAVWKVSAGESGVRLRGVGWERLDLGRVHPKAWVGLNQRRVRGSVWGVCGGLVGMSWCGFKVARAERSKEGLVFKAHVGRCAAA